MFRLSKAGIQHPSLDEMTDIQEDEGGLPANVWMSVCYVSVGIVGLVVGGKLIVENAITIAPAMNVSETIIGLSHCRELAHLFLKLRQLS